ncbi:type IV secretion system protein, VirB6 family [Neorickettsia risticii str. Illinois]|uniref:Type IV secretion system protein, VirB6 family n=2 Tax=Neorickettsia risticii TaxID=950 RepID=C6V5X9_NEORI|nr:type IV secretion system protein, VirB6 family [Neorickettsia risticii str. Illinois]
MLTEVRIRAGGVTVPNKGFALVCLLVLLCLSGCAGECISGASSSDIREGTLRVCPNPGDVGDRNCLEYMGVGEGEARDARTHWVNLGINLEKGDIFEYRLEKSEDYSLCYPPCPDNCLNENGENLCDTPSCRSVDLEFPGGKAEVDLNLLEGDEVLIGLRPALEPGLINNDICAGKDARIYPGNYQECMKRRGEPYGSLFAPGINLVISSKGALDKFKVVYSMSSGIDQSIGTVGLCKAVVFGEDLARYEKEIENLRGRVPGVILHRYCKVLIERAEQFIKKKEALVEFEGGDLVLRWLDLSLKDDNGQLSYLCGSNVGIPDLCSVTSGGYFSGRTTVSLNKFFRVSSKSYKSMELQFGSSDPDVMQSGIFRLKVSRKCDIPGFDGVNVYISDQGPNFEPSVHGEGGAFLVPDSANLIDRKGSVYMGIVDQRGDGKAGSRGYISLHYVLKRQGGTKFFSKATNSVKSKIIRILYGKTVDEYGRFSEGDDVAGAVGSVYKAVAGSTLTMAVQASVVLYILVYGLAFLFGLVRTPQVDLIILLVKLGIVAVLFSPNSWKFFNENLFQLFVEGSGQLINYFSGDMNGVDFAFLDKVLGPFSTQENWLRIFSFLFSGGLGILYFFLILVGLIQIFMAMLKIIVAYVMSIVMVAILLCLAPIFLSMIFFKRTKSIFDNWIKNLAQVAVTPVITFAAFAVLTEVGLGIIYALFDFQICPRCVIEPDLVLFKFCLLAVYLPTSYDTGGIMVAQNAGGMPIGISLVVSFIVISNAIVAFTSRAAILSSSIFGAIASDATVPAEQFMDSMKAIVGQDAQTQYQKAHMRHTKELDQEKDEPEKPPKRGR